MLSLLAGALLASAQKSGPSVKVFILSGQSNMQGHGFIKADPARNEGKGSLEYIVSHPSTRSKYRRLVAKDGSWKTRDDVWIHYEDRRGKLRPGYGVGEDCIGPELGFGQVLGDAFKEPILLVKLAWGGKSLAVDFRPPSSGGTTGDFYRNVVQQTQEVLAGAPSLFPELKGHRFELSGFGWHQGWNDRVNPAFVKEYESNMACFIRDIRRDLNAPGLLFVIAETGMGGGEEKNAQALALMEAQAKVVKQQEFLGNAAFVGTRSFWRPKEESPSGQIYHWNSSAETYYLIGEAMGQAMTDLLKKGRSR